MRAKIVATTIAVAASILPGIALADWDFTKWSMTEAQVIAAAKGRTAPLASKDANFRCTLQITPYEFNGYNFNNVEFCFAINTDKLAAVYLNISGMANYYRLDSGYSCLTRPAGTGGRLGYVSDYTI